MDPRLSAELAYAQELADHDRSEATRKAYCNDLAALQRYLAGRGQATTLPIGPLLISAFVGYQATRDLQTGQPRNKISTIERRLVGISAAHRDAGFADPCSDPRVRRALHGARRRLPRAPAKKQHLELQDLDRMLHNLPPTSHAARRARALLLVGIAGALRRSELVTIDADDIAPVPEGIILTIREREPDQQNASYQLPIALGDREDMCAVRALQSWMTGAGIHDGPVFVRVRRGDRLTAERLTDSSVALIVKKHCERVGLAGEAGKVLPRPANVVARAAVAGADPVGHVFASPDVQRDHSAPSDLDPFAFEVRKRAYPVANEARQSVAAIATVVVPHPNDLTVVLDTEEDGASSTVRERGDRLHDARWVLVGKLPLKLDTRLLAAADQHLDVRRRVDHDVDVLSAPGRIQDPPFDVGGSEASAIHL